MHGDYCLLDVHEAAAGLPEIAATHYRGLPGADLTKHNEDVLAEEGHLLRCPVELGAPAV